MDDKELREYRRPNSAPGTGRTTIKKAWTIAHSLQSDIDLYLSETNSRPVNLPKHALEMMLKHMHRELDDILVLLMDDKDNEDNENDD